MPLKIKYEAGIEKKFLNYLILSIRVMNISVIYKILILVTIL